MDVVREGKRTDAADSMAGELEGKVVREHLCLKAKLSFKGFVVDLFIAGGNNQQAALFLGWEEEGESFGDAGWFDANCGSSQLYGGAGDGKFADCLIEPKGFEIFAHRLNGHEKTPR